MGMSLSTSREAGFTLIEVLVASALVVSVIGGLAQLAAKGVAQSHAARASGAALALAQGKLEELRAAPWSYDAGSNPVSDPALAASPADALSVDRDGWCDASDEFGRLVATADVGRAVYRRRWFVGRFDAADPDTLVLKVCVHAVVSAASSGGKRPDACVSTVLARKP
jgi:prepilin-type N-terminal cleavage/methylation domain-containing protein